jgi:hypothetical protein
VTGRPQRAWIPASCLAALLAYLLLAYHGGADSYVRINDNLDGLIPAYVVLAELPLVGALDATIDHMLGELPRACLPSTIHLGFLPYWFLDPFAAFVVNDVVIRLVALFGMATLLRRRELPGVSEPLVWGASLCFALLPHLPGGYLSVAGQPWLLLAVLNVRQGRGRALDWLAFVVFPLYSSMAWVGFYVIFMLGLLSAWDLVRLRRLPLRLLSALALVGGLYALSEYRLLHQTFFDRGFVSFRSEYDFRGTSLPWVGWITLKYFLFSQHHAAAAQFPFVLLGIVLALGRELLEARRRGRLRGLLGLRGGSPGTLGAEGLLLATLLLCGVLAFGVGFYNWLPVQELIQHSGFALLRMFNFHRFQWFHPLLFGIAFALALELLRGRGRTGERLAWALVACQLGTLVWSSDALRVEREEGLTWREFYSPALFAELRDHIGRPTSDYRIASLGLIPGIPLYNGFRTVGGFSSNYPLAYKHRLRRAFAAELDKDDFLRRHYDQWGAHVHIFSAELGMVVGYRKQGLYTRDHPVRAVEEVLIDSEVLRELEAEYVVSAVEIRNHAELGLAFERRFESDESPWQIFLYSL